MVGSGPGFLKSAESGAIAIIACASPAGQQQPARSCNPTVVYLHSCLFTVVYLSIGLTHLRRIVWILDDFLRVQPVKSRPSPEHSLPARRVRSTALQEAV
jgi:hypothetical protein